MYMTGFADEASTNIDGQIKATLELGWENIEARNIDGVNIHDIDDKAFDIVYGKLQDAGVSINCFGSTIANWAKSIEQPMHPDIESLNRAIPRMKKLGTKLMRIMSYAVIPNRSPEKQEKDARFTRLNIIAEMLLQEGIQPVHENCMNFGGMGWSYTLELINEVPGLKLVFDTGNPVFFDDRTKREPFPKQSSWEFYEIVKQHIVYIHIKDGIWDGQNMNYTYPGEGSGDVVKIMTDLISSGYDGGVSIEPHLATVFHDEAQQKSSEELKLNTYVEYGRRIEKIIKQISGKYG